MGQQTKCKLIFISSHNTIALYMFENGEIRIQRSRRVFERNILFRILFFDFKSWEMQKLFSFYAICICIPTQFNRQCILEVRTAELMYVLNMLIVNTPEWAWTEYSNFTMSAKLCIRLDELKE